MNNGLEHYNELEQKILNAYRDGSELGFIVESLNITHKRVKQTLISFKESNRYKRTFTDYFKQVIADRDINGISRKQIANELEINANTVKKACEKFGQALKEKATSENEFTEIKGTFDMSTCPSCLSKKVNEVEENTTYCFDCGSEVVHHEGYAMKVNWEYLD